MRHEPSKKTIDFHRNRINNLKNKFEKRLKKTFRAWQTKAFREYVEQDRRGSPILFLTPDLKDDLRTLLINHYHDVAMGFVPGTDFEEVKQSISGIPLNGTEEEEEEDNLFLFAFISQMLDDIERSIDDQIFLVLPAKLTSIISTTNTIANTSKIIAQQEGTPLEPILATKLVARQTTVSMTETNWIAEASMDTALEKTTPVLGIASQKE